MGSGQLIFKQAGLNCLFLLAIAIGLFGSVAGAAAAPPTFSFDTTVIEAVIGVSVETQIEVSGEVDRYGASGLPPGLVLDPLTGVISGKALVSGDYFVNVSATNADGSSGTCELIFAVYPKGWYPVLPTVNPYRIFSGSAVNRPIESNRYEVFPSALEFSGQLPLGLSYDSETMSLVGTTTELGVYGFSVTQTDAFVSVTSSSVIEVVDYPWSVWESGDGERISAIAYGNGRYVACAYQERVLFESVDGVDWNPVAVPYGFYQDVAFGAGKFICASNGRRLVSTDGLAWVEEPVPGVTFVGIEWAAGRFLAITSAGEVWTSVDGVSWESAPLVPHARALAFVRYANGEFFTGDYEGNLFRSADGTDWVDVALTPGKVARDLVYGAGVYLAVGEQGEVFRSEDLLEWEIIVAPSYGSAASSVIFADGRFLVVSTDGRVAESPDGKHWTIWERIYDDQSAFSAADIYSLDLLNGNLFATGSGSIHRLDTELVPTAFSLDPLIGKEGEFFSATLVATGDAVEFRAVGLPEGLSLDAATGVISGVPVEVGDYPCWLIATDVNGEGRANRGEFSVVAFEGDPPKFVGEQVFHGGDSSANWTRFLPRFDGLDVSSTFEVSGLPAGYSSDSSYPYNPFKPRIYSGAEKVPYFEATVRATNVYGVSEKTLTFIAPKSDWPAAQAPVSDGDYTSGLNRNVIHTGSGFVTLAERRSSTPIVYDALVSADSVSWTLAGSEIPVNSYAALAYGDGKLVAVVNRAIASSSDLADWSVHATSSHLGQRRVAFGGGTFVSVGERGSIFSSPDGETWTQSAAVVDDTLTDVAYGGGVWIAVGGNGSLLRSEDGATWVAVPLEGRLEEVQFGDAGFVAMGPGSDVWRSQDGLEWSRSRFRDETGFTPHLCNEGGRYFAVSASRTVGWMSLDGVAWFEIYSDEPTYDVIGSGGLYYKFSPGGVAVVDPAEWVARVSAPAVVETRAGDQLVIPLETLDAPSEVRLEGLPNGLEYNAASECLEGVALEPGTYDIMVIVSNANGFYPPVRMQVIVHPADGLAPVIGAEFSTTIVASVSSSTDLLISGNDFSTEISLSGLPLGLEIDDDSYRISGSAPAPGIYPVSVEVSNLYGTASKTIVFTVSPAAWQGGEVPSLTLPGADRVLGVEGQALSLQLGTESSMPITFSAYGLPAGVVIDPATGLVSGTPTESGEFTALLWPESADGFPSPTMIDFFLLPMDSNPPSLQQPLVVEAHFGETLVLPGEGLEIITSGAVTGLPDGAFYIDGTRNIEFSYPDPGRFEVGVELTTPHGTTQGVIDLVVAEIFGGGLQILSSRRASAAVGFPFTYSIMLPRSVTGESFVVSALPEGLSVDSVTGLISGVPVAEGVHRVVLEAVADGASAFAVLEIEVRGGLPAVGVDEELLVKLPGTTATLRAEVDGVATGYQWFRNGIALVDGSGVEGSQSRSLVLSGIDGSSAGQYSVRATNGAGGVTSPASQLVVLETFPEWAARLGLPAGDDDPLDHFFGTGVSNLYAYATGISPDGASRFDLPSLAIENGEAVFAFWKPRYVRGIEYQIEFSPDAGEWLEIDMSDAVRESFSDGDIWQVHQSTDMPYQFYRVRVSDL